MITQRDSKPPVPVSFFKSGKCYSAARAFFLSCRAIHPARVLTTVGRNGQSLGRAYEATDEMFNSRRGDAQVPEARQLRRCDVVSLHEFHLITGNWWIW